jgi:hypothetical protein
MHGQQNVKKNELWNVYTQQRKITRIALESVTILYFFKETTKTTTLLPTINNR